MLKTSQLLLIRDNRRRGGEAFRVLGLVMKTDMCLGTNEEEAFYPAFLNQYCIRLPQGWRPPAGFKPVGQMW